MKKFFGVLGMCVVMATSTTGCIEKIDKGYEAAQINTLGSDKGDVKILGTGWKFYNSFKYDLIQNPTFVQEYVWTASKEEGSKNNESITFQSSNSLAFTADVGISFSVREGRSGAIYEKYHKSVDEMVDTNLRNTVRDAFNRMASSRDAEAIYGSGKVSFINDVYKDVREYWEEDLDIKKIYLIGKLDPPEQVKKAINKKIEATQKAAQRRNEVEQSRAEADKKIEEARGNSESVKIAADGKAYEILKEAEAKAKSIELVNKQLGRSPLYIEYLKALRWDGKLPYYMGGDAPLPMINIK